MVGRVVRRMATEPGITPYLRGPSLAVAVRLIDEVLSRCLEALEPGSDLSGGAAALHPLPGEPAAVRTVVARVLGTLAWEQLAEVIGPFDTPPRTVCTTAEVLFDCLVELAEPV